MIHDCTSVHCRPTFHWNTSVSGHKHLTIWLPSAKFTSKVNVVFLSSQHYGCGDILQCCVCLYVRTRDNLALNRRQILVTIYRKLQFVPSSWHSCFISPFQISAEKPDVRYFVGLLGYCRQMQSVSLIIHQKLGRQNFWTPSVFCGSCSAFFFKCLKPFQTTWRMWNWATIHEIGL